MAAAMLAFTGCTHHFLRHATTQQAATVNDVYFEQIVSNLADFHCNPGALPQFAVLNDGTNQVTDQGQFSNTGVWGRLSFTSYTATLQAQRALQENWKLAPVNVPGRLRRMRCAFQLVTSAYPIELEVRDVPPTADGATNPKPYQLVLLEKENGYCIQCLREMIDFGLLPTPASLKLGRTNSEDNSIFEFTDDAKRRKFHTKFVEAVNCNFPRCWYHITPRREVPRNACYVADCCKDRLWVDPDSADALTRFTLTVLAIALTDPPPKPMITVERQFKRGEENWKVSGTREGNVIEFGLDALNKLLKELEEARANLGTTVGRIGGIASARGVLSISLEANHADRMAQLDKLLSALPRDVANNEEVVRAAEGFRAKSERLNLLENSITAFSAAESAPTSPFDRPVSLPLSRPVSGIEIGPPSLSAQ